MKPPVLDGKTQKNDEKRCIFTTGFLYFFPFESVIAGQRPPCTNGATPAAARTAGGRRGLNKNWGFQ